MGDRFDFSRRQQCKLYNSLKLYFFKRKRIFSILFLYTFYTPFSMKKKILLFCSSQINLHFPDCCKK